ncbi:alpha/beta hydrolase [Demequina soli]|uniref:alpha/beta hydrolase n=1 Tax=Demequina soli TaxID=1638987 RepID=UPI000783A9FD|nr:alpha/beta fold hydrolase [Demequina soli]
MTVIATALRSTPEPADASSPVLVLLHGFGSHEGDLVGLVPHLGARMPWASLRGPIAAGVGAAWFPIVRPGSPDEAPVVEATEAIWAWIDAQLGADARVVPLGFSQGGLMASQLLRTRPERVPAAVVLGGFVLGAPQPGDAALAASPVPVFWGRGAEDLVIAPHAIERTAAFLPGHSALDERVYPGLAHGIDAAELADVRAFLASVVPVVEPAG